jgi:hypothetical protein
MKEEREEHVVFGVGTQFWYDDEATKLVAWGFPVGDYAGRHACGDPGEAATTQEEVLRHAINASSEKGEVTSAYLLPDGRFLCFTTIHEKQTTYIYVRASDQNPCPAGPEYYTSLTREI